MTTQKFYRTVITVEVLSEEPTNFQNLAEVHYAITEGDCSGQWAATTENEAMDAKAMAQELKAQGSDPSFFGIEE